MIFSKSIEKEELSEKKLFNFYINNQNFDKSLSHFFRDHMDILSQSQPGMF